MCILIDYFFSARPCFFDPMVKLRVAGMFGDVQLWCSAKSFRDVFCASSKGVDPVDLQKAFLESLRFLQVASADADCVKEACLRGWDDFKDRLVAVMAERCRADVLIARDVAGFRRLAVPVMTSDEYLAGLKGDEGIWYVTEGL